MKEFLREIKFITSIIIAVAILFLSIYFYSLGKILSSRMASFRESIKQRHSMVISDVQYIRSWMTFEYINRVFNLPNDYLKNSLNITNPKYPHLTLTKSADENRVSSDYYLNSVRNVISQYIDNLKKQQ